MTLNALLSIYAKPYVHLLGLFYFLFFRFRDHLKTRLTLVILGMPDYPVITSEPFVIQARDKSKKENVKSYDPIIEDKNDEFDPEMFSSFESSVRLDNPLFQGSNILRIFTLFYLSV